MFSIFKPLFARLFSRAFQRNQVERIKWLSRFFVISDLEQALGEKKYSFWWQVI